MPSKAKPARPGTLLGAALDDLAAALRGGRSSLAIATPFLSLPVAELLIRSSAEGQARTRRLLTAVNVAAVEGGYLDPDAIRSFVDAGFDVRSLRNLHAKVVLVDRRWGIVGSGNLTVAGSNGGNAELGVVLDERQAAAAQGKHFDQWWEAAKPVDMAALRRLRRRKRPRSPERRQREGQGGFFRAAVGEELNAFASRKRGSGYWLKIMYGSPERGRVAHWRGESWVSDRHTRRNGKVLGRPGYKVGDHLVIYLSRTEPKGCPAIVRVTDEPRFDPELVAAQGYPGDEETWGWVTPVRGVAAVPIARAPGLADLGVASTSVRQHGHIHLSPETYHRALRKIRG
jgi:hypothetical protein